MIDALLQGLSLVLQWKAFSLMLVGMALGFVVGLLPGIGGAATLALMLPFIFKMSRWRRSPSCSACIRWRPPPATSPRSCSACRARRLSAATVVDGHPMAKNGEAGARARRGAR